jgi:hypothetical protein
LAGAVSLSAVAGCLSAAGTSRLGKVTLTNRDDDPHEVQFRVTWDGDVVHDRTYDLAAADPETGDASGAVPDRTWPEEAGQFRVAARLAGGEWSRVDPADGDYPDCFSVLVTVDRDGYLAVFTSTNPNECDPDRLGLDESETAT